MEIQSTFQTALADKNDLNYMIQMSQEKQKILSRDHSVASNVVRHFHQNGNLTAMKESTLVRSHSAVHSVKRS